MLCFLPPVFIETYDIAFTKKATGYTLDYHSYGGVEVYYAKEVDISGGMYSVFEISLNTDVREVMNTKTSSVKAALISPNEVAIRTRAMHTQFTDDYEEVWDQPINKAKKIDPLVYCPSMSKAHSIAHRKIKKHKSMYYRIIILKFPSDIKLSNEMFSPRVPDGVITIQNVPMKTKLDTPNGEITVLSSRNLWKVNIHEDEPDRIDDAESDDDPNMERMASMLGTLNFGTSYQDDDNMYDQDL